MKLKFYGELDGLEQGIRILCSEVEVELAEDGIPLHVEKTSGNIEVSFLDGKGSIRYDKKIHFFRALGLFIENMREKESFAMEEKPQFQTIGALFDVSKNAVLRVDSIKTLIRKMAFMGFNMFLLNAEDTYAIKDWPYFGYMRGRYSQEELKDCDDYADIFGIEMILSIQTLSHLSQALQWDCMSDLRDTSTTLLVGSEKTYELIEDMLKAASEPLRSKRIHIGMDEAHNLGLGNYLHLNGYHNRFDIMCEHLSRVVEIASRYGLKPMMWSDMFFRLASKKGDYYDREAEIPAHVINRIPNEVELVYWDYYHNHEHEYLEQIERHARLGKPPIFAGGIWTWHGLATNYKKTFATTNEALRACKKQEVTEVIATMWADNGAETNFFSALLGMQLYAEHAYASDVDLEKLKSRTEFCTGIEYDAFMDIQYFDAVPGTEKEGDLHVPSTPSRFLLWQDLLMGLFDKHIQGLDLSAHYSKVEKLMGKHARENGDWGFVFEVMEKLGSVLSVKCDLGIRIKDSYEQKNSAELKNIMEKELPELYGKIEQLRLAHRNMWFRTNKPFGWEIVDIRYGGLLTRVDSTIRRLQDYLTGRIGIVEELEEERLYFDGPNRPEGVTLGFCNMHNRIVSASVMGSNWEG